MLKSLNLIASEERKEIRHERMFMIVRNLAGIFIGTALFLAVTLFIAQQTIQDEASLLIAQAQAVNDRSEKINTKVTTINKMLSDIEKIQKEDTGWDAHVISIVGRIPEKITISALSVDKETLLFSISGVAPTRPDFATLKSNFDNAKKLFKDISAPTLSLTAKENIPFTISGRLIIEGFTAKVQKAATPPPASATDE